MKRLRALSNILGYCITMLCAVFVFPANAEIGFDSDISTVNLAFSLFVGLVLSGICFFVCYILRMRSFTSSVAIKNESPLEAFQKYWGSGSKWLSGFLSFVAGSLITAFTYWLLKGDFAI